MGERKKNQYSDATHCIRGHLFDEKNTYVIRAGDRKGQRRCRECQRLRQQRRTVENPERQRAAERKYATSAKGRLKKRTSVVLRLYGQDYSTLLSAQQGRCAACGTDPSPKPFHVDHDHGCCPGERSCGKCVRGLLCPNCNWALGLLGDSIVRMEQLAGYLRRNGSAGG